MKAIVMTSAQHRLAVMDIRSAAVQRMDGRSPRSILPPLSGNSMMFVGRSGDQRCGVERHHNVVTVRATPLAPG